MAVVRSSERSTKVTRIVGIAGLLLATVAAVPRTAWGIKWAKGCPEMRPRLTSAGERILTTSPFVHPGHEVGYFLQEWDASRRGGFSVEPGGNTIEIHFRPPGGPPIALPPFTATAVSPTALYFDFPDTREQLGRVLAGPIEVVIRNGEGIRRARQPVALPPANDVLTLLEQGMDAPALGAMDALGRLWIPLEFSGFGPGEPMPSCPMDLTQKMAFAVGFSRPADDSDDVIPHASFTNFRRGKLYFGDFLFNGQNVYGMNALASLDVRAFRGGGVVICGVNDALSLVLMVRLKEAALGPRSRVVPLVRDGSPLSVQLTNISAEPAVVQKLHTVKRDSFGTECLAVP